MKNRFVILLTFILISSVSISNNIPLKDENKLIVPPHKEQYERFLIVWLEGTPYEMGYQQGKLLHDELQAGIEWLQKYRITSLLPLLRKMGFVDLAWKNSYPDIIEECQGLVDAASDTGWTMEICLLLNFGDVLVEFLTYGIPSEERKVAPGCTQVAASGKATIDGRLYHGRSLDWSKVDYLLDYPVIFVRQPSDGLAHTYIGFPGNLSPYSGMNVAGLSIASNEAYPYDESQHDLKGRSHVQMVGQLLKKVSTLEEAKDFIRSEDHMSVEIIMVADGVAKKASVFEMTSLLLGIRDMKDGVVYTTNHFVAKETVNADEEPTSDSSLLRYDRLEQIIPPYGKETYYGKINAEVMVKVLRDRVNPYTGRKTPAFIFDNDKSIATNGAIYQIVFDPEKLFFWVAAGEIPVPSQPFIGFSLGKLLSLPNSQPCNPPFYK